MLRLFFWRRKSILVFFISFVGGRNVVYVFFRGYLFKVLGRMAVEVGGRDVGSIVIVGNRG